MWDGPILEIARESILSLDNSAVAHLADEFKRAIGRAGIGNNNLVRYQTDRLDTFNNMMFFILARNDDRQLFGHNRSTTPSALKVAGTLSLVNL